MNSYVIGTIQTRLDGKTVPYYPETIGEAITLPKPGANDGSKTTLQELIDTGALSGLPLQHKTGFVEATTNGQKVFKVELEDGMPPLEKMGVDVHVKSVWYSPTRYTLVGSNIILNDNDAGLMAGDKLEYTLHYGQVAGLSISMDRQVIEVKEGDTNVFTITKANYNPARYTLMAVVGSTLVVPERLNISINNSGEYTVEFKDFTEFAVGKIITLLYFYDTPPTGMINGGSLTQIPVSAVMQETGRIIPIPLDDYTFKKYTVLLFINSTFIAPRKYTIDEQNKLIILKEGEEEILAGKTIDFIFTAIQKDINMVENMEFEKLKELMKYRTRTLSKDAWVADETYSEFPYSQTITDYDITSEHLVHASFPMNVALKYSGIICTTCETVEYGFKIYSYEIPKEDLTIKYLIGRG